MHDVIKDELLERIADWQQGKPIRTIAIGHRTRRNDAGQEEPQHFRQRQAHDYAFHLIEAGAQYELPLPFDIFSLLVQMAPADLTAEERQAAESLAWKVLAKGWRSTIGEFPEADQITLAREADA
jgi:hypothetical protein